MSNGRNSAAAGQDLGAGLTSLGTASDPRARLAALVDRPLTAWQKVRLALMGLGGLAGAAVCGSLAATEPAATPVATRIALAVLALVGLSWTGLSGWTARRGTLSGPTHGRTAALMGLGYSAAAAMAIGAISMASSKPINAGAVLLAATPLALAMVVVITHWVRESELRVRRDLLEMEVRLTRPAG